MSFTVTDKRGAGTRVSGAEHPEDKVAEPEAPPWFPVFLQFEQERVFQIQKWGDQRGKRIDGTGLPYYKRSADEFKRQNDAREAAGKPGNWFKILAEELYEAGAEEPGPKLFHELRQVGAVATAWMEDLIYRGAVELG